jgi:hypothetical protein
VHSCFDEGCIHWTDTSGHRIEAHGAGLSQSPLDGRWYWYGESKKYPQASTLELGSLRPVQTFTPYGDPWKPPGSWCERLLRPQHCRALAEFEGQALGQTSTNVAGRTDPWVIERP